jgi:hypothetical protein
MEGKRLAGKQVKFIGVFESIILQTIKINLELGALFPGSGPLV